MFKKPTLVYKQIFMNNILKLFMHASLENAAESFQ